MTVRYALVWALVAVTIVFTVWQTAGALDNLQPASACNPSGTIVESTGLVIRDHTSSLCEPGSSGG